MPQPHDELFRTIVAHPEDAQGLIAELLPPLVRERIDWSTLAQAPGTFVMPELATRHVDALFTARIAGRPALLYLLLEHQSEPDPLMPLRMAGYMVRIYDDVLRKDPSAKRVPMIVPLVVHHGEGGWTAPRRFQEMLDAEPEILAALACHFSGSWGHPFCRHMGPGNGQKRPTPKVPCIGSGVDRNFTAPRRHVEPPCRCRGGGLGAARWGWLSATS